jgi:hypothetical protein
MSFGNQIKFFILRSCDVARMGLAIKEQDKLSLRFWRVLITLAKVLFEPIK